LNYRGYIYFSIIKSPKLTRKPVLILIKYRATITTRITNEITIVFFRSLFKLIEFSSICFSIIFNYSSLF